jgi:hypothetical protein
MHHPCRHFREHTRCHSGHSSCCRPECQPRNHPSHSHCSQQILHGMSQPHTCPAHSLKRHAATHMHGHTHHNSNSYSNQVRTRWWWFRRSHPILRRRSTHTFRPHNMLLNVQVWSRLLYNFRSVADCSQGVRTCLCKTTLTIGRSGRMFRPNTHCRARRLYRMHRSVRCCCACRLRSRPQRCRCNSQSPARRL